MTRAGHPRNPPRLGPYAIVRRLGAGGMADVVLAEALDGPLAGRQVAIKRLKPEAAADRETLDRFLGEMDLTSLVTHPNLVETLDVVTVDETHYAVMEYVDGRDLAQVIHRCRTRAIELPVAFCTHIVARVLEALGALHGAVSRAGTPLHVVHCDVNPSNVFVSRAGEIKLGDLGVAVIGAYEGSEITGRTGGKLVYLAPEQSRGKPIDARTDLFAAGVTLYELLTCRRPFEARDLSGLKAAHRRKPPPITSTRDDVPPGLAEVIRRALATAPRRRYPSAEAFMDALSPYRDPGIGNDLSVASVVRSLFPE